MRLFLFLSGLIFSKSIPPVDKFLVNWVLLNLFIDVMAVIIKGISRIIIDFKHLQCIKYLLFKVNFWDHLSIFVGKLYRAFLVPVTVIVIRIVFSVLFHLEIFKELCIIIDRVIDVSLEFIIVLRGIEIKIYISIVECDIFIPRDVALINCNDGIWTQTAVFRVTFFNFYLYWNVFDLRFTRNGFIIPLFTNWAFNSFYSCESDGSLRDETDEVVRHLFNKGFSWSFHHLLSDGLKNLWDFFPDQDRILLSFS